jgi:hypothetical protein
MVEIHDDRVHTEDVVLDIGGDIGALILYTRPELRDREIELSLVDDDGRRVHNQVHERITNAGTVFAAVYPELPAGTYHVWGDGSDPVDTVTIRGGEVAALDWSTVHRS